MNEHSIAALTTLGIEPAEPVAICATPAPGTELFVINLCASMTPMPEVPKNLKGFESYKLYQVSKVEDGRRRFRLRLGFFTSETDAELVVSSVRNIYPAAFTGCLSTEDLRYTGGFQARPLSPTGKPAAVVEKPALAQSVPAPVNKQLHAAASVATATLVAPKSAPTATFAARVHAPTKPAPAAAPALAINPSSAPAPQKTAVPAEFTLELDLHREKKPAAPAAARVVTAVVPFHVAKGVTVPDVALELAPERAVASKPTAPSKAETPAAMAAAMATNKMPAAVVAPAARDVIPPPPRIIEDYIPILDTTLTLRTLTQREIEDPNQPAWYVVELALSDHPVNLDTMPKLDIFAAYNLYSVAVTMVGTIRHALRLGFFREAVSAEAVSGYLKTFFPAPTVTRVSAAEHTRFAEQPRRPAASIEKAVNKDKVVQFSDKRPASSSQTPAATAKPAAPAAKPVVAPAAATKKTTTRVKGVQKSASRSLSAQLREEARQVMLSESGMRKAPPKQQSFLSRLIGRSLD